MVFIEIELETVLPILGKLEPNQQPLWGSMSAQRMVEHLTDLIQMSVGKGDFTIEIPEEKIESMQRFIDSDKPMARGVEVALAPKNWTLRNEELELAIDEFVENWISFEEFFEENPDATTIHPFYGALDEKKWRRMHSKHFTHHFQQFGLI